MVATDSLVLGLDIGGTKLAAGVVTPAGEALSFVTGRGGGKDTPAAALERLFALGRAAVAEAGVGWGPIARVGIGCGGPLDPVSGLLLAPPHLPRWRDVPVVALAEAEYGLPATLENDASAAALAEHRFGAGVGSAYLVYLTVSTGIGGGAVLDGDLYRGAVGNGGEFGHVTVRSDGRACRGCGRHGCLEAYASGTSIAELAAEAMAGGVATRLPGTPTAADVADAVAAGDPLALRVWEDAMDALGCGVTSIVNVLQPEVVVLGGGVTGAGELLFGPLRTRVTADAMAPVGESVRVLPAALGRHVGVVGAAAVAQERKVPTT